MKRYVALLRAVNVGGTGKLPMTELRRMAEEIGLGSPRTYIASGNLLFTSDRGEAELCDQLEERIAAYMGKPVPVMIRTAEEMRAVAIANPFTDASRKQVLAVFLPEPPPADALDDVRGQQGERLALGAREIYVDYCGLLGRSKLAIMAASAGTARNMNSVEKLAGLAEELE